MILDIYFRRPLFWDYFTAVLSLLTLIILFHFGRISIPEAQESSSLTGDLTNISLTLVGFVLTIVTVLITFKDNSSSKVLDNETPTFNKFFATDYYYETIKHLKNCIKSISTIAAFGFLFKLFLPSEIKTYLFFFNVMGFIVIMLTVYRCLLILGKILELQKSK